ncbi:serine hydrolase [Nakamurella sp. YIM 132087]|uniref:Serine hydrolase n=1 Tax=Nakamurella alba TaxID=2665158 RepID=A0A7K1FSW3_9ACTN|nr:serine hydrolase domain-containing protein [Nakamurella alba]MTD17201.1 serine hydrolase [Nakamurella alba]
MTTNRTSRSARRTGPVVALVAGIGLLAGCTGSSDAGGNTSASPAAAATTAAAVTSASSTTSGTVVTDPTSSGTPTEPTPPTDTVDRAALLDQALAELVAMPGGPPGAIAVVQIGDERTVHTAGFADVETKTDIDVDDHMRIASVAKAFSGATALALVDAGELSLDDTIGDVLPAMPKAWAAVTLRQLMNHTSGVPDFLMSEKFRDRYIADPDKPVAPKDLVGSSRTSRWTSRTGAGTSTPTPTTS